MFYGEYRHTMDEKSRLAIPARFRPSLPTETMVARWLDSCAAIFPPAQWRDVTEKLARIPTGDAAGRALRRFITSSAYPVEFDRQGRAVIPQGIREWADLSGEVVVVGNDDHVELWNPQRWATYIGGMSSPDVLAEHLQGLGF